MKRKKKIFPWLMVLSGLLIFGYPFAGSFLARRHATVAVERVREQLREEDETWERASKQQSPTAQQSPSDADSTASSRREDIYRQRAEAGVAVGVLSIPSIDLTVPVYEGAEEDILRRGIGHMPETDLPLGGGGTHTALSGHRGLGEAELFANLDLVQEGDRFTLEMPGESLIYEVDRILVVEPQETEMLAVEPGQDLCTLVTCTPRGINSHRLLVRGHRVAEPADAVDGAENPKEEQLKREDRTGTSSGAWKIHLGWAIQRLGDLWSWLALAAILILGLEALWFLYQRRRR